MGDGRVLQGERERGGQRREKFGRQRIREEGRKERGMKGGREEERASE